ncbi:hypothetical protein C1H46_003146 [Malus baccata]|uniref:Glycine dehydrogenase C-terminal domain-containing protein n=1 Tax=Malus baccata TaxID=106549 RepID=A0A540NKV5_MALBA|nr:hypothetical protein C1H46_003146 [Malus baccata]
MVINEGKAVQRMRACNLLLEDLEQLIEGVGRTCRLNRPVNLCIEHIRLRLLDELLESPRDILGRTLISLPFTTRNNYYPILFRGVNGTVAHEFIVDLKGFKNTAGIEPEDVPKRLMDYGFHGPTMSWPVPGTRMIDPTESESKAELDRFCDALISIREEIAQIQKGKADILNNVLKGAPHPPSLLIGDAWTQPYSREYAAFPASWLRSSKFWPTTAIQYLDVRVDNMCGEGNLIYTLRRWRNKRQPPLKSSARIEKGKADIYNNVLNVVELENMSI